MSFRAVFIATSLLHLWKQALLTELVPLQIPLLRLPSFPPALLHTGHTGLHMSPKQAQCIPAVPKAFVPAAASWHPVFPDTCTICSFTSSLPLFKCHLLKRPLIILSKTGVPIILSPVPCIIFLHSTYQQFTLWVYVLHCVSSVPSIKM